MTADQDRIWRAAVEIGTCMMVTRHGDALRARPMQALVDRDENTIWFLSDRSTHKNGKGIASSRACLAFSDVEEDLYVSLSGQIDVIDDRTKVAALLSVGDRLDDDERVVAEDLIALRFIPDTGEIWDGWGPSANEDVAGENKNEVILVKTGVKIAFRRDGLS
jgi:hypothetical protein